MYVQCTMYICSTYNIFIFCSVICFRDKISHIIHSTDVIYFLFIILINKRTILACETFSSAKKYNVLEADSVSSNINKRDVGTSNIKLCIKQNGKNVMSSGYILRVNSQKNKQFTKHQQ